MSKVIKPVHGNRRALKQLYIGDRIHIPIVTKNINTDIITDIITDINTDINIDINTDIITDINTYIIIDINTSLQHENVFKKNLQQCKEPRLQRIVIPTIPEYFDNVVCVCGKPAVIIFIPCQHKASCRDCYRVTGKCPRCDCAFMTLIES